MLDMRLIVCMLIICALLGCNSEQKSTGEDIVNGIAKTQYYNVDSVSLVYWDSTCTRGYPYDLISSTFDSYLGFRFDYYIYKTDGQSFPRKLVAVSNDSISDTLNFAEELDIWWYKEKDSLKPKLTFGSQLNNFTKKNINKYLTIRFTYTLLH